MRINLVVPYEKEDTGVSNYFNELFEYLNNKVDIKKSFFQKLNINLPFFDITTFLKNHPLILPTTERDEIIHIPNFFYAIPFIFNKHQRKIITIHDLIPSTYPPTSLIQRFVYRLCLCGAKKADRIIVDSENTKKDVVRFLKYPLTKIDVIPLGVNVKKFKRNKKIKRGQFLILYVGSEMPRKNLIVLIKAFAKLKKKLPQARLVKVGKSHWPGARQNLIDTAKESGVLDSIEFKDYVDDVIAEYNKAELFVFPSLYEGFGLPILEAMACGLPVICSNKTSLPEVGGRAALYFDGFDVNDLAEKMFNVLTDKKLKNKLVKSGLKRVKQFSWEKTAKNTLEVYKKF